MERRWRIELLGQLRLGRGDAVPLSLQRQKSTALLAYLAYHTRHPHSREVLIEFLWPEADLEVGRGNLRVLLHALRARLADPECPAGSLLVADRTTVHLDRAAFTTDVAEFHAALQAAARAADLTERGRGLEAAVALYRGELLPGSYEAWVLTERQALGELYLGALRQLVAAREAAGDLEAALAAARQAVGSEPLQEEAHYDVMRLAAALGQPSAALRQYQELERVLREELDETPSAEARALAEELRRDARTLVVARRSSPPLLPAAPAAAPPPGEPPAAAATRAPRLPVQLTRFFGREEETAWLVELLASGVTRLVTLTGPGGSGKTRLATAVAGRLQELFGEAVAFVSLGDLVDAGRIMETIADTLELPRVPNADPFAQVVGHLQGRPWLLVLDNFEQLIETGAGQVRTLLERVETLTCLVTSRQVLGLSGEHELALLPLPTPRRSDPLERLREYASVQLFVDRARAVRAEFALTEANAPAVGELCDRLEGLPLALELAAARAAVLTPQQMLAQLEQRFAFLVSRRRDVSPRHRTLRATIESSYQLLEPVLQQFFARLAVFRGGWTLEAAHAVCHSGSETGPGPIPDPKTGIHTTLERLEQLRDTSLIAVEERGGAVRYRLLETLREYGWEQLAAAGELSAARKRHRDWYLQLAEQADAAMYRREQKEWLARLEGELENLRAALAWCQEEADAHPAGEGADAPPGAEAGLRLAAALWGLWLCRGYLTEGLQWLEGTLARSSKLPASLRAPALFRVAGLARSARPRGDRERSRTFLQEARREYEQVLMLARREGNRADVARALLALADITGQDEDLEAAWRFGVEARPLLEELGEWVGIALLLERMAGVALKRGDRQTARPLLEERLAICRKLGNPELLVHALGAMGHLERDVGDYGRARAFYQESLLLRRELGNLFALAQALEDLAVLAGRQQEAERAIRLLGAAEAFCETLGAHPPVAVAAEYERTVTEGRAALGEAGFAATWAEGRALSLEQATEYALEEPLSHPPPA